MTASSNSARPYSEARWRWRKPFVGAVGIFRLQRLHDERERLEPIVRGAMFEIHGHDPAIHTYTMTRIIEWFLKAASGQNPDNRNSAAEALLPHVNAWIAGPGKVSRSRRALIAFEAWNLAAIGVALIGFNHVKAVASLPLLGPVLLWVIVIGTVFVTIRSVVVWTKG